MAQGAGRLHEDLGEADTDAYVPRMVHLGYLSEEGSNPFPRPGWAARGPETRAFHGPSGDFTDPFSDDDGGVQPVSQGKTYANPELQETPVAVAVKDHRVVAQPTAGVVLWGLRGTGPEPGPPSRRAKPGVARR